MKRLLFFSILLFVSAFVINAQKISILKGSVLPVKSQKIMRVTFDYSDMAVGKFDKEEDYLAKKTDEYNKKEAGRGDKWAVSWKSDRADRYEPSFEELFNKYGGKADMSVSRITTEAQVEMNVHTIFTEPGFNVYVTRKPAMINAIITFKNISTGEEIAVLKLVGAPGTSMGMGDYDTGVRISEAYAKLGKSLAAYIVKQKK